MTSHPNKTSSLIGVEGLAVKVVIDTGAEVTVISTSLFEKIPKGNRPKLQESRRFLVVAEEGKRLKTQGVIEANLTTGNRIYYNLNCQSFH
jgi:hypothetical protein